MENWTLTLTLSSDYGQKFSYGLNANGIAAERMIILSAPPTDPIGRALSGETFDSLVKKMKKRELRKDVLKTESMRLGILLAEYMEDKEGWHGTDRQERILQREHPTPANGGSE